MLNSSDIISEPKRGLINPHLLEFFMIFNLLICSELIGLFGIFANVINIVVFTKQGFQDSVNVTLTALAISDIGALVTLQLTTLLTNPFVFSATLSFSPVELLGMVSFYPHNYFIRVSGFITSFAAVERCLCVVMPLKVKGIITSKVAVIVNVIIFLIISLNMLTPYYYVYFSWTFVPFLNTSILGVSYREGWEAAFGVSYFVTDLFEPYFTFFILIVSTFVMTARLKSTVSWRKSVTSSSSKSGLPSKEKRLVVMLATVSLIFIICLIPQSAILTAVSIVQELNAKGAYFDVALVIYCISYLAETICSSVNILVYYKMSSKYRETINNMFKGLKTLT
ncbi:FMRFamide receptor [Biomphalaria glabrata]|nr:FMRFamide receptor [Biomphalaria glabrata]